MDSGSRFASRRLLLRLAGRGVAVAITAFATVPPTATVLAQSPSSQPAGAEQDAPKLKPEQIEALVAPIALYPDELLSQALMASTYPLEIIQAQQWADKNKGLKGDALEKGVQAQNWDPSVQATVMVPDLLKRLSEDITWTTNLGNAFLAQQQDVMDAVQRLRVKAKDAGKLESNDKMKVETQVVEKQTVVVIQPASPQVVYVPAYNPTVIWGPPVYPYPPVYYPPPPPPGAMLFTFSMGVAMGAAMHGGYCCSCGWGHGGNTVVINNNNTFVNNYNRTNNVNVSNKNSNWQHNSQHRGGAPYSNQATASKYGGSTRGGSPQASARTGSAGGATAGNRAAGPTGGAGGASGGNRAGGGGSGGAFGGGSSGYSGSSAGPSNRAGGGGDQIGNRGIPSGGGSKGTSAFGGGSSGYSGSSAKASSSRGASSMASSGYKGGGGGSRGGGGGRGGGGRR